MKLGDLIQENRKNMEKPKRGWTNSDGEFIQSLNTPQKLQMLVIGFIVGMGIIILFAISGNDNNTPSPPSGPDMNMVLSGCLSKISTTPYEATPDEYGYAYWNAGTVGKFVSDCMTATGFEPVNNQSGMPITFAMVENIATSCIKGIRISDRRVDDEDHRNAFANCVERSNIGWRQIGYNTATPNLKTDPNATFTPLASFTPSISTSTPDGGQ